MRVLLDGYWWHEGPLSLQRAVRSIASTWRADYPGDELGMLVRTAPRKVSSYPTPAGVRIHHTRLRPQALAACLTLPVLQKMGGYDVVLAQNYTPFFGKSTVLIHDVLFKSNPEWFTRRERIYFAPMTVLARRAAVIFATTNSEARRIASYSRAVPIVPVGLGVGDQLRLVPEVKPELDVRSDSFLLTVGRLNVRKNLERTIDAALKSETLTRDFPLIIVGEEDGRVTALSEAAREALSDGTIMLVGKVNDSELRWLYANTAGFVFMSLGEGFGLPPLEAKMFDAPVMVSDIEVFRETLRTAGTLTTFADPNDVAVMADSFRHLAAYVEKSTHARRKKIESYPLYNWHAVVSELRNSMSKIAVS